MEKGPLQTERTLEGKGRSYAVSLKAVAPAPSADDEGDSRDAECRCDEHGRRSSVTSLRQEASSDDATRLTWFARSLGCGWRCGRIRFYRRRLRSRRLGKRIAELNRLDSLPILGITEGCFELALFVINNGDRNRIGTFDL